MGRYYNGVAFEYYERKFNLGLAKCYELVDKEKVRTLEYYVNGIGTFESYNETAGVKFNSSSLGINLPIVFYTTFFFFIIFI